MAVLIGVTSVAGAQPAPPPDQESPADAAFREGREFLEQGKADEACERFEASFKLVPDTPATMLNLGACNEARYRTATALRWYRRAQARGSETGQENFEAAAKAKTQTLAVRVPTVRIVVVDAPPNAVLTMNGTRMADIELSRVEVDPGRYVFELAVPGRTSTRLEVLIADGERKDVRLVAPKTVRTFEVVDPGAKQRLRGYIVGGTGLALLGGSLALALVAQHEANGSEHPVVQERWRDRARYGGSAMFIVGGLATAYGAYQYFKAPGRRRVEKSVVMPVVGPKHVGVTVGLTF